MRNALLIAYYFSPSADVGAKRAEGFFRYLPECGYRPIILTVKDGNYLTVPGSTVEERPDVVRVAEKRWPARFHSGTGTIRTGVRRPQGRVSQVVKRCFREVFYIPDGCRGFYRSACRGASEIVRQQAIDVIFTTSGPYTLLRIGHCLTARTGIPWVADFRDLWVENHFGYPYSRARRVLDSFLQRRWLSNARRITTATEGFKAGLEASGYGSVPIDCVYGGYLETPRGVIQDDHEDQKTLRVCFTGKLYEHPRHSVEPLFKAIDVLRNTRPEVFRGLQVDFYGIVNSDFAVQLDRFQLHGVVRFHGLVSREEATQVQAASDVLFLLLPDSPEYGTVVASKTFDYMAARKPLLAVVPKGGENARLLDLVRIGRVFSPTETADIAAYLSELTAIKRQLGELGPVGDVEMIETFSYRRLASRLAHIFDAAIQSSGLG